MTSSHSKITCKATLYSILVFSLIAWPSINVCSQFKFETLLRADADFFTIDPFDNIYFIETGAVVKVEKETKKKTYFSSPQYGNIDFIDSSNPLDIIAFSEGMGNVIFLDNNLVEKHLYLGNQEVFSEKPGLVCNSKLDGFWIYNPAKWQFLRINRNNQVLASTTHMDKLQYPFSKPCFMVETGSRLFVSDPGNGIFVFDGFGGFLFRIHLTNVCMFQVKKNNIIYFSGKHLYIYDFFLHKEKVYLLPENNIIMGKLKYPNVYLLTKNGIKQYALDIQLFK